MTVNYLHIRDTAEYTAAEAQARRFFPLHQSLRPHFSDFAGYFAQMKRVLDDGGQLLLAEDPADGTPLALALFRIHHNTYQHKLFFLEDLVVAETRRSSGIGGEILNRCETVARQEGCLHLSLDSATFRTRAHKFYYLQGYVADCFHFSKRLD